MGVDREPVVEALDGLVAFVDDLDRQLGRKLEHASLVVGGQVDEVTVLLQRMRHQRQRLAQLEALAERHVAEELGTGQHAPAGIPLKVNSNMRYTDWQHREVARLLVDEMAVDKTTGEIDVRLLSAVRAGAWRVVEACRPEWRVTDLKAAGLDLDGLCKREPYRKTVQFLTPAETR